MEFRQSDLLQRLEEAPDAELDRLDFGVIRLDHNGRVLAFSRFESEATGLSRERVLGRHFFTEIAPCMDNATVAGRLAAADELDLALDYVFALRLKPVPVRLRLLKSARATSCYLVVERTPHESR